MKKEEDLNMDMFIEIDGENNPFADEEIQEDDIETPEGVESQDEDQDDPEKVVEDIIDPEGEIETNNDNDVDGDDNSSSSSNPNLFKSLATLLKEKALISSEDFNVETEDDFVNLFKGEIDKSTKEYLVSKLGERGYKSLEEGIPYEKVNQDKKQLDQLESVTNEALEQDVDLRKRVIYQDFINRGYSEEKAAKLVQRSLELDVDLEDAQEAMASIKEFSKARIDRENEEIKNQKLAAEKAKEDNIKKITKEIESIKEVIPGYEVSENVKNKIKSNMFNVVGNNPINGAPENALMKYQRENPIDFDKKLYYMFTITNGFTDFNSIKQESQSKALQDLERAFNSTTQIKDPGSPAYLQDPNSYLNLGDEIVVD